MTKAQFYKLVAIVAVVAIVIAAVAFFAPKLTHHCDHCGVFFLGTGYSANILSNTLTAISGQADKILCRDCAAKEHALAIATGKSVEDFKRPLFNETTD